MADNKSKLSVLLSEKDIQADKKLAELLKRQKTSKSALEGELGLFKNPDGSISTERSTTVKLGDGWYNIPMLVKGQDSKAIQRILNGKPTQKDYDIAIKRAIERAEAGMHLPAFRTVDEAVRFAKQRSAGK